MWWKKCLTGFLGVLLLAAPVWADVYFQCPTNNGSFADNNGDGVIRAEDGEISNPKYPTQVCIHLTAGDGYATMADGSEQYIFGFRNVTGLPDAQVMEKGLLGATLPGGTIELKEGDYLYLTLTNVGMQIRADLFDPHTVHWHGYPNAAAIFDGVPDDSISINMGSSLTYFYKVNEPGTYLYHCHVEATEHMQMGMYGNLYVHPAQDGTSYTYGGGRTFSKFAYNDGDGSTGYDVEMPIQISGLDPVFHKADETAQPLDFVAMEDTYPLINGRGYPDTINPNALPNGHANSIASPLPTKVSLNTGQRLLLRINSLSTTSFHTLTAPGLAFKVVGVGSRKLDQPYWTSSVTLGGGEAVDVIIDTCGEDEDCGTTGDNVEPGTYFFYTTNLDHLNNHAEDYGGMMTEILVQ